MYFATHSCTGCTSSLNKPLCPCPPPPAPCLQYGVVACWGLGEEREVAALRLLALPCSQQPLGPAEMWTDELEFVYSAHSAPHIQNDTITINKRQAANHQVRAGLAWGQTREHLPLG